MARKASWPAASRTTAGGPGRSWRPGWAGAGSTRPAAFQDLPCRQVTRPGRGAARPARPRSGSAARPRRRRPRRPAARRWTRSRAGVPEPVAGAAVTAGAAGHPGQQPGRGGGGDPAAGLLAGQLAGIQAPQLAGVREVEAPAHGRPQPGSAVSAKVSARGRRAQAVAASAAAAAANDGGSRRARSAGRSGNRIQRPPGRCGRCGALLQLVAEQAAQVVEDAGLDRRAAGGRRGRPGSRPARAGRGPAGAGGPLQHHHPVLGPGPRWK